MTSDMKFRKPTTKERFVGVLHYAKMLVSSLFTLNIPDVKFAWMLICLTIKGGFEVGYKEENND